MAKAVRLSNGRVWKSRKDAIKHFKEMLGRYGNGDKIVDPQDESDLRALLSRYDSVIVPGTQTKAGAGVVYFSRQLNSGEGWATPGFHVHRVDGTSIDFSFYGAVQAEPP